MRLPQGPGAGGATRWAAAGTLCWGWGMQAAARAPPTSLLLPGTRWRRNGPELGQFAGPCCACMSRSASLKPTNLTQAGLGSTASHRNAIPRPSSCPAHPASSNVGSPLASPPPRHEDQHRPVCRRGQHRGCGLQLCGVQALQGRAPAAQPPQSGAQTLGCRPRRGAQTRQQALRAQLPGRQAPRGPSEVPAPAACAAAWHAAARHPAAACSEATPLTLIPPPCARRRTSRSPTLRP